MIFIIAIAVVAYLGIRYQPVEREIVADAHCSTNGRGRETSPPRSGAA